MSRRSRRAVAYVAALGCATIVAACGGGGGHDGGMTGGSGGMMNGSGGMMNGGRAGRPARPPVGTFPTATGQGNGTGAGDGGRLFLASCGGCHTLAAAGTTGSAGPDLDQARPSYARVVEEVTDGGDGMPSFADSLTGAQIRAIAGYVAGSVR